MYPRSHTTVNGTDFHVASRYRIIKPIGSGAYGIVVSAEDTVTGRRVAIKKVGNAYHDLVDAKRVLREIKLMRFFGAHENLVTLVDMEEPLTVAHEDVYIITELMETDLHRIIYSKQKLTDDHFAYFTYQLLRAMKYMHSANVIHRDLKPSNILLNSNCDLRVCDYGLARGVDDKTPQPLTEYVVTRWYRAPEIMLACKTYTKAVDMWSIGCIFAEMLRRKPLFPGSDYMDQLRLILSVVGSPSEEDMAFIKSERARAFMAKHVGKPKQPWSVVCRKANPLALDLLDKMLQFNPAKRITVEEALAHPYLSTLHCPDDEPAHAVEYDFGWEKGLKLDKAVLQRMMYEEAVAVHRAPPATVPAAPAGGAGAGSKVAPADGAVAATGAGVTTTTTMAPPAAAAPARPAPGSTPLDDEMKGVGAAAGDAAAAKAGHVHKVTPWPGCDAPAALLPPAGSGDVVMGGKAPSPPPPTAAAACVHGCVGPATACPACVNAALAGMCKLGIGPTSSGADLAGAAPGAASASVLGGSGVAGSGAGYGSADVPMKGAPGSGVFGGIVSGLLAGFGLSGTGGPSGGPSGGAPVAGSGAASTAMVV